MSLMRRHILESLSSRHSGDNWWTDTVNIRFDVEQDNTSVKIVSGAASQCSKIWLDDDEIPKSDNITLNSGIHWVHCKLVGAEITYGRFSSLGSQAKVIEIPSDITSISDHAFSLNSGLTEVVFRGTVKPKFTGGCMFLSSPVDYVYTAGDVSEWGQINLSWKQGDKSFTPIAEYSRVL